MIRIAGSTLGAATLLVALTVMAADTLIDNGKSKVIATFKQEGVAVEAPFLKYHGRIAYNPANVAAAGATLEVETGSLDVGDAAWNDVLEDKVAVRFQLTGA